MKRKLYFTWLYIKYHDEINSFYRFSLKGQYGEQVGEDLNFIQRTGYWLSSI